MGTEGTPTIVAMGGVEFSMRPENEAIHDYVIGLAAAERPRICHLPTASGDPREQIAAFHTSMDAREVEATTISLFRLGESKLNLAAHLLAQDIVYVGGGSLVNLIALWREHGLDSVMGEAHASGVILCGYSAGSMCWFEHGVSRGSGKPAHADGLGLLSGSHCVHYSQDPARRSTFLELVGTGAVPGGLALDDHSAALFRDGELIEAVRSREGARAFAVSAGDGVDADEAPIGTRMLQAPVRGERGAVEEMRALRRLRSGG